MAENAPFLPDLSPVSGKPVHLAFDGGRLTSDAGGVLLAEIERKLRVAERLACCIADLRAPERVRHSLVEMIRYRALLIAAGYPDANDCDSLRDDPARDGGGSFARDRRRTLLAAHDVPPGEPADEDHAHPHDGCPSPASWPAPLRGSDRPPADGRWSTSSATASSRCRGASCSISRESLGDTFDRVHGGQQLWLFHAHHDSRCFLPMHIYEAVTGKPVAVILRPGKTPDGTEVALVLRHLVEAIRRRPARSS